VRTVSQPGKRIRRAILIAVLLASADLAEAQVGLTSRGSRVALIAHVPSSASMQVVGLPRVLGVRGSVREAVVTVRLASNSGYRLLVRGTAHQGPARSVKSGRIWVQGQDGEFHELRDGSVVTVAHHQRHSDELEREVRYRYEHSDLGSDTVTLPMRYEIAVRPVM
jgi:hypothetical protein